METYTQIVRIVFIIGAIGTPIFLGLYMALIWKEFFGNDNN